jgi:uncharacterized protein YyaL (SSP411 family)
MSPYLQQHADNPVDWWPWCDEAFQEARERNVPVFLSVGYSACHWCHVMAHESFENDQVARVMNDHFVNIKVDREELPAVDAFYMDATQAMTGHGGWPMSVWLDHDRSPWYAGTYFPPEPRHGMPSFTQVLTALSNTWITEHDRVLKSAAQVMEVITLKDAAVFGEAGVLTRDLTRSALQTAVHQLVHNFDPQHGGFGGAPKFPAPLVLEFLMRYQALSALQGWELDPRVDTMLSTTFERMARGGIYDQVGGGFARYSVDATWTVPHFEKMLYDNAQLLLTYAHWYRQSGDELTLTVVHETAAFIIRELQTPQGGFASALDADSLDASSGHSEEGVFYAWTVEKLCEALGAEDGNWAAKLLGVTDNGNFENGMSVPTLSADPADVQRWQDLRCKLYEARALRPRPARDDKVVAAWNGLAIRALAEAGNICQKPEWVQAATAAADLLVAVHLGADSTRPSRLARVSRDGVAGVHAMGVLEDQALVSSAFIALAQVTGEPEWLTLAHTLLADIQKHFVQEGGLSDTADDELRIIDNQTRRAVELTDNVTPSGWAATVDAALSYAALTGDLEMRTWVDDLLPLLVAAVAKNGRFAGWAGAALTAWLDGPREVAVLAAEGSPMPNLMAQATAPGLVFLAGHNHEEESSGAEFALLEGRTRIGGHDTAYVCQQFTCSAPTSDLEVLSALIGVRIK